LRILQIHTQILGNGGIPRFNRNLVSALDESISISLNDAPPLGLGKNKIKFILRLTAKLIRYRPERVIIGHLNFAPLAVLVKLFSRAKVYVILHGIEAWEFTARTSRFTAFIDNFWAVSSFTKRQFENSSRKKYKVEQIFNTLAPAWPISSGVNSKYFLTVTRLDSSEKYKGVEEILQTIAELKTEMVSNDFTYKLVAHGNDLQRHLDIIDDLNIENLVQVYSGISDFDLQRLYQECSFFALPSTGEGFGIVYLESMAMSKACIGSYGCGAEDVIEHGATGYLVDQSPESLYNSIRTLLTNPELCTQMGKAGQEKLQKQFNFQNFKDRIESLLV